MRESYGNCSVTGEGTRESESRVYGFALSLWYFNFINVTLLRTLFSDRIIERNSSFAISMLYEMVALMFEANAVKSSRDIKLALNAQWDDLLKDGVR